MLIFVLNPGGTSLKYALFRDEDIVKRCVIRFEPAVLQMELKARTQYCRQILSDFLLENALSARDLDCVVARGGLIGKVETGAYQISEDMIRALDTAATQTPQTIGIRIAYEMMHPLGKPCYIYDAVSADEWDPIAKITGVKGVHKTVAQHTLNSRSVGYRLAEQLGRPFSALNLIVAHLGGGIDTTFFRNGRIIESLGYNDLGFSPERCGALQFDDLLALQQTMEPDAFRALNHGKGGLVSYFGTSDMQEVQAMAEGGDQEAMDVLQAMFYRVSQLIGCGAVALHGKVDGIILTGGGAYSPLFCQWIEERVRFIGPVYVMPGEMEMEALANGALRVLRGEETAKIYETGK